MLGRVSKQGKTADRPRVVDIADPPRHLAGEQVDQWTEPEAVVVLVHWSDRSEVSRSVVESVRQFLANGYRVALCSSAESLHWPEPPAGLAIYRRPNIGYDFGSWAAMLTEFPQLRSADRLLLINDSLVGPFADITPILQDFHNHDGAVWGLVSTTQDGPHLQSHFVGYRGGVLAEGPLARFWDDIRVEPSKRDLILRYEIGQHAVALEAGYEVGSAFPWSLVVNDGQNPTSLGWRRLLIWGFPYVKREIVLRPPPEVPDGVDVAKVVKERFGQEVREWV